MPDEDKIDDDIEREPEIDEGVKELMGDCDLDEEQAASAKDTLKVLGPISKEEYNYYRNL